MPFARACLVLVVLICAAWPLAAQDKKAPKKGEKPTGPACPVSGKQADSSISAPYKGCQVFFDTAESKAKFEQNPAQYGAAANYQLFATGQVRQVKCPIQGVPLGGRAFYSFGIALCCPGCQTRVNGMNPQARLAMMFGPNFDSLFTQAGK